jgi:predicted HTH domain antitoxin
METRPLELPADLLQVVSQLSAGDLASETAKLLALELFREDRISMGRAAELCHTPLAAFMEFAAEHKVPIHYGVAEWEEDRRTLEDSRGINHTPRRRRPPVSTPDDENRN